MLYWGISVNLFFGGIVFLPHIFSPQPAVYLIYAILPGLPALDYVYHWLKRTQEFEEVKG